MNVMRNDGVAGAIVLTYADDASPVHSVHVYPNGDLRFYVAHRECFSRPTHVKMLESHNLGHLYYGEHESARRAEFYQGVKL